MNERWRGLEVFFAGAIAFFTFVLAIVSYYQWRVTNKAANAAKTSADASIASVRAWLAVINYDVPDAKDANTGRFEIDIKNVGKTPATGVAIQAEFIYIDKVSATVSMGKCPDVGAFVYGALQPNDDYLFKPPFQPRNFNTAQIGSLVSHTAEMAIHGCVHYGVIPGNTVGSTEFCSLFYATSDKTITLPCGDVPQIMN